MKKAVSLILAILLLPEALYAKQILHLAGMQSTKDNYDKLVAEKGGNPLTITDFNSSYASRPVLSMLIIRLALNEDGMDTEFHFHAYPNHSRSVSELKKGKVHVLASDMWETEFDETVYKTSPFIRKGEFVKGIYTRADSHLLKEQPNLEELRKLKPITELAWEFDIEMLNRIGFKKIEKAPTYSLLFKMLHRKRADFALLELHKCASPHYWNDKIFYPIKGAKIVFPFSRHFMVSKINPEGEKIYKSLERGLKKLRKKGIIKRALYESGVFCKEAQNWKVVWPEPTSN